ncbi:MAG: hypothetical protein GDA43_03335 [Hormoscilla sp. SP5CHS1]|nr:hypothetical protein [Hormoscilla sp. SP12CHS1]MBC6452342.1 hypothetical protein [Hormoscilla sp. SP5CHS1]
MTNALPGKREFWGNLVQGVKAIHHHGWLKDPKLDREFSPLRVFLLPPALPRDSGGTRGFPKMEQFLGKSLLSFFEKYTQNGRQIGFLANSCWRSNGFYAATEAIDRKFVKRETSMTFLIL